MKKKNLSKKLILKKETVALLDDFQQNDVRGGYISYTCPGPQFCGTEYPECNTNRCTTGCPTQGYPHLCDSVVACATDWCVTYPPYCE